MVPKFKLNEFGTPVIEVLLGENLRVSTEGVNGAVYVYLEVGEELVGIGAHLLSIAIQLLILRPGPNFSVRVIAQQRVHRSGKWVDFSADVLTVKNGEGQYIGPDYTIQSDFGRNIRFRLAIQNTSGTDDEFADVTAYAHLTLKS